MFVCGKKVCGRRRHTKMIVLQATYNQSFVQQKNKIIRTVKEGQSAFLDYDRAYVPALEFYLKITYEENMIEYSEEYSEEKMHKCPKNINL